MITRKIIIQMLSYDITEHQTTDRYVFDSGAMITWVEADESFRLDLTGTTDYASPGNIEDLIDQLEDDDLEAWFNEEYTGYSPAEILETVLDIVGSTLETAE